jgi:uncharacterized repeat protein (TIGR02543 family)
LRIGTDNRTNNTFKQYLLKAASITDYYDYGGTLSNLPTSPTRPGYTFGGWYTAASGGTQVTSSTSVPSANTTYYAHWTAKTYTLTINPQGGTYNSSTSNATKTMTFDSTNNNDIGVPTRDGYTFAGWYTSASGGTAVTASTVVNTANNHSIFAHWSQYTCPAGGTLSGTTCSYAATANYSCPNGGTRSGTTCSYTATTTYTCSSNNHTLSGSTCSYPASV